MKQLYRVCGALGALTLIITNVLCQGHAESSSGHSSQKVVDAVDLGHQYIRHQEKMQRQEVPAEPKTIARVIFVSGPDTTQTVRQSTCLLQTKHDLYESMTDSSFLKESQKDVALYGWTWVLTKPVFLAKAMLASVFTFILKPTWLVAAWVARVLLFRPAVFIYLLFLEKPFQTLLAFVLWILPLLAFVTAVTFVAILIGGSFGWVSAIAIGIINTSTRAESRQQNDDRSKDTIENSGPQRVQLLFNAPYNSDSSGSLSNHPEMWSRRRRTKPVL